MGEADTLPTVESSSVVPLMFAVLAVYFAAHLLARVRVAAGEKGRYQSMVAICAKHDVAPGPLSVPFGFWLMSAGEQRGFQNELTRVADYWFLMGKSDYYYFTILTATFPGLDVPQFQVARRGLPDTLAVFGGPQKVELESIDFTGRFAVRAQDARSAVMMLEPAMMQWVMDCGDVSFEFAGDVMLAYVLRQQELGSPSSVIPVELEPLFGFVEGFGQRIPTLVRTEYGTVPQA